MTTPKLETDRLILREIHSDDAEAIFSCWMQDENVSRYMWWKASNDISEAKEFVEFELENLNNDKWDRWIIILKGINEIIGTCLIFSIMMKNIGIFLIISEKNSGEMDM